MAGETSLPSSVAKPCSPFSAAKIFSDLPSHMGGRDGALGLGALGQRGQLLHQPGQGP